MIEFRSVSKIYHTGTHALKDVNFKITDGEFVFVIGRSGAGKSTLIKLLTCEEKPSNGSVLIDDFDISRIRRSLVPFLRRNIGMVFQDFRLIETKSVFENVAFAMEIIGASRKSIRRRVPIVLSIVGLRDKSSARPGELSGGEQQRVAIARAMVNNPMLILADEPTGNLDPSNSESVMALLEEISRGGTTVVICTHDRDLVDRMKKRVIEIDDGILVRDDCQGAYAACNPVCPPAVLESTSAETTMRSESDPVHDPIENSIEDRFDEEDEAAFDEFLNRHFPVEPETKLPVRRGPSVRLPGSRSERLARALMRHKQNGHEIYLPELDPAFAEPDHPEPNEAKGPAASDTNRPQSDSVEPIKMKSARTEDKGGEAVS